MAKQQSWGDILSLVSEDLAFYGGKRFRSKVSVLLFDARFRLMASYRISRFLYLRKDRFSLVHRWLAYRQRTRGANDISPRAVIGRRLRLPHPLGIVIGEGVVIADDVTIFQRVTIGSHGRSDGGRAYPLVGPGVVIFAGAAVLGPIRLDAEAVVGAGAVVLRDVPAGHTAVGVPARLLHESD